MRRERLPATITIHADLMEAVQARLPALQSGDVRDRAAAAIGRLKYVSEADLNGHFCVVSADLGTSDPRAALRRWRQVEVKILAILDRYAGRK